MSRLRKILLSQNSLAKALGATAFFASTKFNHHLAVVKDLEYRNALVLAPHPDDDVFGCGGVIEKMSSNGADVTVAYFCDGAGGMPEEDNRANPDLVETRKKEAEKSGEILGVKNQIFFGYPDGKLAAGTSAVRALRELILRTKPDIIFVPSFLDNHPDHRVVNEIVFNAVGNEKVKFEIWAYEVWTPIFVNRLVGIDINKKQQAMKTQESQLQSRGYDKAILGLNQYRAEMNNLSGYAEGFFATTYENYKKLYLQS